MIDHYENPRNVGKLDARKKNVGTGLVGAPACGDVMRLQIEVRGGGGRLKPENVSPHSSVVSNRSVPVSCRIRKLFPDPELFVLDYREKFGFLRLQK